MQQILTGVIEELKPGFGMVFRLRYLKQLSTNATAQTLKLPVSTVKTRLRRARLELRRVLEKTLGRHRTLAGRFMNARTHCRNPAASLVRRHREYMSIFSKVNEKETSTRAIEEDVALSGTIIERRLSHPGTREGWSTPRRLNSQGRMINAVKFATSVLAVATACLAQEGLTIDNKHKERVSTPEAEKIYFSACSVVEEEFVINHPILPPVKLVLGANKNVVS